MPQLPLDIPDDLYEAALKRLGGDEEELRRWIVCELGALVDEEADAEIEKKLLEGLASPVLKDTPAVWREFEAIIAEHEKQERV
jgi:hypothetical protein